MELSRNEVLVLKYLSRRSDQFIADSDVEIENLDERAVSSAISYLVKKGLVESVTIELNEYSLGEEGAAYLNGQLPEEAALNILKQKGNASLASFASSFKENELRVALTQLAKFGVKPEKGFVNVHNTNLEKIAQEIHARRKVLESVKAGQSPEEGEVLNQLLARKNVLIRKTRKIRRVRILPEGLNASSKTEERIETLNSEILLSGEWKTKGFREYDLNPAKLLEYAFPNLHPLSFMIERVRKIFLQMGFTEMSGTYLESALWNMDALFIPQNHPARDMQDTFYVKTDQALQFTEVDKKYQKLFSNVHEKGIKGYTGWGGRWSKEESERPLLRTHTTASTIKYLAEHPTSPQAIFSVDKAFRHESMDWKHLAELHQIEGAVLSKDVSLGSLKWIIKEFYSRLGLKNIRFIPSYYPYTEPSMDIVAEINGREVELGGSGIFRQEVTLPLGINDRVMAWGMGLERFAMLYYNLKDIREIYRNDLGWLSTYKIPLNFKN